MSIRGESGHINTDYCKNSFCTIRTYTSNSVNSIDSLAILVVHIVIDFIVKGSDVLIEFVNVQENNAQHPLLKRRQNPL